MPEARIPKELQQKIFELTLALYRVTDFFPPGEVLRKNLREKANEIFGSITEYGYTKINDSKEAIKILARIEAVRGYLRVAKSLRLVRSINIAILDREYSLLGDFFIKEVESLAQNPKETSFVVKEKDLTEEKTEVIKKDKVLSTWEQFSQPPEQNSDETSNIINERQQIILDHLKQVSQAKISDFFSRFNSISSKTIQRDLQDLVFKNILKKEGEKRWTTYSLNVR